MVAQFQLQLFGSPQLVRGRSLVRFRTKKQLAVRLYLHFEGRARAISRDRLVDLLWPDVPADKGRHSLSQALLAIRSRLGTDAVTGREQDVQLLAELPSELSALRQGQLATVRVAEPLLGLDECAGAEFAHWVDGARVRLKAQARDALRAALQQKRAKGNLSETHLLAAALYDLDPLCTHAVYALAERALLDGDTVAAVRLLKDQVRRAQAELGANPNPEIARLLRRLERGERPGFLAQPSPLPERLIRPRAFVAREVELGQLEAIWSRVGGAAYQTCLISGAPGIGKSSLIRRFATSLGARALPGFMVTCQEIGQGIPYATVSELRPEETGGGGLVWKETIHLQPLERPQALNLISEVSADAEDVSVPIRETIVRLAQGNPYHIEMLLADWRTHRAKSLAAAESSGDAGPISWTPPEDLRAAFARQYGGLSTDAQHVLQILSVAGKAMAPNELARLL